MFNIEEIDTTPNECYCDKTCGCEKCRPKINIKNSFKTYIPTEFEIWKNK